MQAKRITGYEMVFIADRRRQAIKNQDYIREKSKYTKTCQFLGFVGGPPLASHVTTPNIAHF